MSVLEHSLLLESSNELLDGSNFDAGLADRGLLDGDGLEACSNIYAEIFRLHLVNGLLTSLWRERKR